MGAGWWGRDAVFVCLFLLGMGMGMGMEAE